MKVFTRDHRITGKYHPLWDSYFGGMEPCVLDIEATGLDRSRCKVVLIGLLMRTASGVRITQFLAENHYEEAKVLSAAMDMIEAEGIDYLITFNGCAYDVPFINARLDACNDGRRLRMYQFDLYRFLVKATDMRKRAGSMSQMALEDRYGILSDRGDTITGRESVTLFDQYAINGNSTLEKIILTHNREDVLHLHRLMYLVLADIPSDAAMESDTAIAPDLHTALAAYGFPACGGRFSVRPSVKSRECALYITGEQIKAPVSGAYFPDTESPLEVGFNASSSSFEIKAPVSRHGSDYYMDLAPLHLEGLEDEDNINGYLILGSRTVNLISRILVEEHPLVSGISRRSF